MTHPQIPSSSHDSRTFMDPALDKEVSILRKVLNYFGIGIATLRTSGKPTTSFSDSPIRRLPPELLHLIVDHVDPVSGASFSLSCRYIYSSTWKKCLESPELAEGLTKLEFLKCLERDLPFHVVCSSCVKLHHVSHAEKYHPRSRTLSGSTRPRLECRYRDLINEISIGTHPEFSSVVFHMAMKAYRQSSKIVQLLRLLGYETKKTIDWGFVEQRTVEARIQDGSLLLREQRIFVVPSTEQIPLPWCGGIDICPHIQFATMAGLHHYGIHIPFAAEVNNFENRQGILSCQYCYTEFRVDFKGYGNGGNAMFLTKWMDLGEGRDLNDHKFRSRISNIEEKSWTNVAFRRGSICAAFEQHHETAFRFDSLLSPQDQKDLCMSNSWPWPKGNTVSFAGVKRYYKVVEGKFEFLPSKEPYTLNYW